MNNYNYNDNEAIQLQTAKPAETPKTPKAAGNKNKINSTFSYNFYDITSYNFYFFLFFFHLLFCHFLISLRPNENEEITLSFSSYSLILALNTPLFIIIS